MGYTNPKSGKSAYRIRRHPSCADKCFYVTTYGDEEKTKEAALAFYANLPSI